MSLRIPYFKYIVNNYLDMLNVEGFDIALVIPESFKMRTRRYLTDCDFITNWFMETYEKTEDGKGLVQMKDVYDLFKLGEVYCNMNKQEKRTYTKTYFIEKIKNKIFLKFYYKERETRKELLPNGIKDDDTLNDIDDKCIINDDDIQ